MHETPSQQLARLAEEQWQHQLQWDIGARRDLGLPIETLPDPSFAQAERDAAHARTMLQRIAAIDESALSDDERITRGVLEHVNRMEADALRHYYNTFQVTPYASQLWVVNTTLAGAPLDDADDLARYLRVLDQYPRLVDHFADLGREQQRRGILIPKPELPLVRAHLGSMTRSAESHPLFVEEARLAKIDPAARGEFTGAVRERLTRQILPALQRLAAIYDDPAYEAAAPEAIGLAQYPGGAEAYRFLIRFHTTLDLAPEEVHQLGLREVARIDAAMQRVRETIGFRGTKGEFHQSLRSEPRLFAKSGEEIGRKLSAYLTKIEPQMDRFFAKKPRAPYGVRRLEPGMEALITFGYYQQPTATDPAGYYFYNGSTPEERSLLPAASLIAHELAPGHHFQIARQMENDQLPMFRRRSYQTAYVEGWGEYAAMVAGEMGVYSDPYDEYGRLTQDMMLSVRLVVDTGMNALGWSRERAMAFMREHTLLSDTEIATESLRYGIDIPAQALSYKIGGNKIMELRRRSDAAGIDPRDYHEWVLGPGSMPLSVLEAHVTRRVAAAASRPSSSR